MRSESPHAKTGEGQREESILGVSRTSQFLLEETGASVSSQAVCWAHNAKQEVSRGQQDPRIVPAPRLHSYVIPSLLSSDVTKSLAPPWSVTSGCLEPLQATIIFINRPASAHHHICRDSGCQRKLHSNLCTQCSQVLVTQLGAVAEARGLKSGQSTAVPWP